MKNNFRIKSKILALALPTILVGGSLATISSFNKEETNSYMMPTTQSSKKYLDVTSMYGSYEETFAVVNEDGRDQLWGWGANEFFELGTGDQTVVTEPRDITPEEWSSWDDVIIKDVATKLGSRYDQGKGAILGTFVLVNDGSKDHIYHAGNFPLNSSHSESVVDETFVDVTPEFMTTYQSINAIETSRCTLGIDVTNADGEDELWMSGIGSYGELGIGRSTSVPTDPALMYTMDPVQVETLIDKDGNEIEFANLEIKDLVAGENTWGLVAIDSSLGYEQEKVFSWGDNSAGLVGNGTNTSEVPNGRSNGVSVPTEIPFDFEADDIFEASIQRLSLGDTFGSLLVKDIYGYQYVYQWGSLSSHGGPLLNEKNYSPVLTYTTNPSNTTINDEAGIYSSYVIKDFVSIFQNTYAWVNNGKEDILYSTGTNKNGQLGIGKLGETSGGVSNTTSWKEVSYSNNYDWPISAVYALYGAKYIVLNDGFNKHIYTWGVNNKYQTGNGTNTTIVTPIEIILNPNFDVVEKDFPWLIVFIVITVVLGSILAFLIIVLLRTMHNNHSLHLSHTNTNKQ